MPRSPTEERTMTNAWTIGIVAFLVVDTLVVLAIVIPFLRSARETTRREGWTIRCLRCGYTAEYAGAGGIRAGGRGSPRTLMKCPSCARLRWAAIERPPQTKAL
jgi:hypothetical protein